MKVLFDGEVAVHHGFLSLQPVVDGDPRDLLESRGGQQNGLCGAAFPGLLSMVTGLHTGDVPVRLELHDVGPGEADPSWEEVVEVPVDLRGGDHFVMAFGLSLDIGPLPAGPHRARWCARGMDAAGAQDTLEDGEPAPDAYLLQLWPAPWTPDAVLRETSASAGRWHETARTTPAPEPPPSPEEVAAIARRQRAADEEWLDRDTWGGLPSTAQLRALGPTAAHVARLDRTVVETLVALPPATQRAVAAWAARLACDAAGVSGRPEVAEALAGLDRGETLGPPWLDRTAAPALLDDGDDRPDTVSQAGWSIFPVVDGPGLVVPPESTAAQTVCAAGGSDPAAAAVEAVAAYLGGTAEPGGRLAEVRTRLSLPPTPLPAG